MFIYTIHMPIIIKRIVKKVQVVRYWLFPSQIKLVKKEVKEKTKGDWKNESELMRHIINNWFEK